MYTYANLKEALSELSDDELKQPVVITDDLETSAYFVSCTDQMGKFGSDGFNEQFKDIIPTGQCVICLDYNDITDKDGIKNSVVAHKYIDLATEQINGVKK
jgi:hypothetical protein